MTKVFLSKILYDEGYNLVISTLPLCVYFVLIKLRLGAMTYMKKLIISVFAAGLLVTPVLAFADHIIDYSIEQQQLASLAAQLSGLQKLFEKIRVSFPMNVPQAHAAVNKTKVVSPVVAAIPLYNLSTACQASSVLSLDNSAAGLAAGSDTNCPLFVKCRQIAGKHVTSCVAADFDVSYSVSSISISHKAASSTCGDSCSGSYCGTGGSVTVFTSNKPANQTALTEWSYLATRKRQDSFKYDFVPVSGRSIRSVLLCRGGEGVGRDNVEIDHIQAFVISFDIAPPSVPTGLTVTVMSSFNTNIAWAASTDDVGVAGYRVERCTGVGCSAFMRIASSTVNSYTDTSLSPGTFYTYRVRAYDAAGNVSGYSNSATGTTTGMTGHVGKSLMYSLKYRTTSGSIVDEYLQLGHADFFADGSVRLRYYSYDANRNLYPIPSIKHHDPMNAPYGGSCASGPVQKPTHNSFVDVTGTWTVEGDLLKIRIGAAIHEWRLDGVSSYRRNRASYDAVSGSATINGVIYSDAIGFGYIADSALITEQVTRADLLNSYDGEYFENNRIVTSDWWYGKNKLSVDAMASVADPDVWGLSYSCPYYDTAGKLYNTWCESTLLFNDDALAKNFIFLNGGHDYNENGCLDETDRSFRLYGVRENGKIQKIVWVEYSYELDNYPLMSLGHYYPPVADPPTISFLAPNGGEELGKGNTYKITWDASHAPAGAYVGNLLLRQGPVILSEIPIIKSTPDGFVLWTVPISLSARSDYKASINLYDKNGWPIATGLSNTYFTIGSFSADSIPPQVVITAPINGIIINANSVSVMANASDSNGIFGVQFLLDGELWAEDISSPYGAILNTAGVSSGTHALAARARDKAGNLATSNIITITINPSSDTAPPTVSLTAPADGAIVSSVITVSASASDNVGVVGVQFRLDGFNLGAEDTALPYSVLWNTITATNASHALTAVARDAAGNMTTAVNVGVVVSNVIPDTIKPIISNIQAINIATTSATVSWITNKPSTRQVEYGLTSGYGPQTAENSILMTGHSEILTGLVPNTLYHYRVKSKDVAGNLAISGDNTFQTVALPDTTAPAVIMNLTAPSSTAHSITLSWTASGDDGTSGVATSYDIRYSLAPITSATWAFATQVFGEPAPFLAGTIQTMTIGGFASATTYYIAMTVTDEAGNVSLLSNVRQAATRVSLVVPDIAHPVIANLKVEGITSQSAVISWATDEPADAEVRYGIATSSLVQPVFSGSLSMFRALTLTNLLRKTRYWYQVFSNDANNNRASSTIQFFTTVSGKPPGVKNLRASNGSVVLSWENPTKSEDPFLSSIAVSRSISQFPKNPGQEPALLFATVPFAQSSVTDGNAVSGTTYFYSVFTVDDDTLYSDSAEVLFTPVATSGGGRGGGRGGGQVTQDTIPSLEVTVFKAVGADHKIILAWKNPRTGSGQIHPDWIRTLVVRKEGSVSPVSPADGFVIYEGTAEEFTDTNLDNEKKYGYAVFTFDQISNYLRAVALVASPITASVSISGSVSSQPSVTALTGVISITKNLGFGMAGDDVLALQFFLVSQGYLALKHTTGYFGNLTKEAVQSFQRTHHIAFSAVSGYGFVGLKTRNRIAEISGIGAQMAVTPAVLTGSVRLALISSLKEQIRKLTIHLLELQIRLLQERIRTGR